MWPLGKQVCTAHTLAGPVVADEHAGEAGQDAKAVGGGVAAVLVGSRWTRPHPMRGSPTPLASKAPGGRCRR